MLDFNIVAHSRENLSLRHVRCGFDSKHCPM